MKVRVEVWPVGADEVGIWLLSGDDALRSGNIASDADLFDEARQMLKRRGMRPLILHGTSNRQDGPAVILTYVAVVETADLALSAHPTAKPVGAPLQDAVGRPYTHAAAEPPTPRDVDALMHTLRHLAFLRDHDVETAAQFSSHWRQHLEPLEPALAMMYSDRHEAA